MKIGIVSINVGGPRTAENMVEVVQHAEAAGIESVWTFEHVVVPADYESKYPYDSSGKMPAKPETWFIDPLISLAHVAAATKTIRLGTGVNIFPQTNPMLFAKQTASLDALSGGRLTLGLGIGWLAEEYQAMGTPFERRGARFDDYLEAVKKVWSGEVVEHESEFLSWHGFKSYPTPAQKPHPPILIGGTTIKTLRRVVNAADGWYAPSDSQEGAHRADRSTQRNGRRGRAVIRFVRHHDELADREVSRRIASARGPRDHTRRRDARRHR